MARGRHWLMLFQGQGTSLLVYVMLRRHSLHPSSDSVQAPRALLWHSEGGCLGAGATLAWQLSEGVVCCSRSSPAFSRGELLLSCLRGSLTHAWSSGATGIQRGSWEGKLSALPRGLTGTWWSLRARFMQHRGPPDSPFLPDIHTVCSKTDLSSRDSPVFPQVPARHLVLCFGDLIAPCSSPILGKMLSMQTPVVVTSWGPSVAAVLSRSGN